MDREIDKIIIIDYGGQYAHLIANRIRRLGVYTTIVSHDITLKDIDKNTKGIIFSGGPNSVYEENSPAISSEIIEYGLPILGLCYGHQLIAKYFDGEIKPGKTKEFGKANMEIIKKDSLLFSELDFIQQIWMSHGDAVSKLPKDFEVIGKTEECYITAMENSKRKIYGMQFHPEVTHSTNGNKMLENFIYNICKCNKSWDNSSYLQIITNDIVEKTKLSLTNDKKILMLVSGGVDSTVAFTLLNKIFGKEKVCGLFINNGLLRKDEYETVIDSLNTLDFNLYHTDASDIFIDKLKNVYEPELKRKIIGDTFIEVQKNKLLELKFNPDDWLLGQGTIYPDTIESGGTQNSKVIKTHHNRVEMIEKMIQEGKVVEPLVYLYKDEVRELGLSLGLSSDLILRHPFPGPGLGVRCLCNEKSINLDFTELDKNIKNLVDTIILQSNYKDVEILVNVISLKSVGVQGDYRTYSHPVVLKSKSIKNLNWDILELISTKITNNFNQVNRVMILLDDNLNDEVELKNFSLLDSKYITNDRLNCLKIADSIAMTTLKNKPDEYLKVWQMPTILVPYGYNEKECIILRPISSIDAMSAHFTALDKDLVFEIRNKIIDSLSNSIAAIFYDITNKPPGTIEWE